MPELLARLGALSYRYPGAEALALRDVDLEVAPGELIVLSGRSGSGKTTLLHALCGLVPHYHGGEVSGSLEVTGLDVAHHGPGEIGAAVGLVGQDPETQVVSAVARNEIELPLEMRGHDGPARARAVEEVALALAIPHLLDRAVDTLSGGELQRVALAAALAGRPAMVLLDEPTSQLDPVAGDELIWLLRRLNAEWGTAVVIAEHRLERCLAAADRVVAVERGGVAFDGEPGAFLTWAIEEDETLATPAARLFSMTGLEPLPTGVKQARETLTRRGLSCFGRPEPVQGRTASIERPRGGLRERFFSRGRSGPTALNAKRLRIELDDGSGPTAVIDDLDLRIEPGERVALMGRNGAGKSTLLRAAAGLIEPQRGRIDAPEDCSLLSQSPSDFLVRERVDEELPGPEGRNALRAVGLEWAVDRDPRDLSGGERQRLALAIVMAGRGPADGPPGVICLDEPTRGMDRARKDELAARIDALARAGSAAVVATHDVEFAAAFAARVVLLAAGRVIADDDAEEILTGGWYFATETARVLDAPGAITPERGAALLRGFEDEGSQPAGPGSGAEEPAER
jgi:energy-coupling factor transport system ATP-binding protein